ncbi:MAG: tetratricopeptide repeat protein [Planctomycetota bacterium]|jgi:tetratricopeptide (TPR) repeat protein
MRFLTAVLPGLTCLALLTSCGGDSPDGADRAGPGRTVLALLEKGGPDGAERELNNLTAGKPKEGWMLYCRGRIALFRAGQVDPEDRLDELNRAERFFSDAIKQNSGDYLSRVHLGKVQGFKGDFVKAVRNLEQAKNMVPTRGDAYFELGRVYLLSGDVQVAMALIDVGLEMDPERPDGHLLYGEICFKYRSLYDEGLTHMRETLALDPDYPGGRELLADSLIYLSQKSLHQKDYNAVLSMVAEALELLPDQVEALRLRAQAFAQTNQVDKALEDLRQCTALDPSSLETKQLLSQALIKRGYQLLFLKRRDDALPLFREAVKLEAPDVDTTVVARILAEDENGAGSESRPPSNDTEQKLARTLFEEASALLEVGKAESALKLLNRSIEILPDNPFTHHQAGLALDMLGRTEEAEKELKLALSLAERLEIRLPASYLKLAEIAIRVERFSEGENYLKEHAERFPDQTTNPLAVGLKKRLLLRD